MRWDHVPKAVPAFGSTRIIRRFAFLPMICDKNHLHWLEFVLVKQWRGSENWWSFTGCICSESEKVNEYLQQEAKK